MTNADRSCAPFGREYRSLEWPLQIDLEDRRTPPEQKANQEQTEMTGSPPHHSPFTIPSTIFLASANSIMVLSRKKSSFSTPA